MAKNFPVDQIAEPLCMLCARAIGYEWGFCEAYPIDAGIPKEILECEVDHRKPYKGDGGLTFQSIGDL